MWKISGLFIVCGLFAFSHSYLYRYPIHPDHPNECFKSDTNETMKPGETMFLLDRCEELSCLKNFEIVGAGCGSVSAGDGCWITEHDYTKKYPACCPTIMCHKKVN